MMAKTKKDFMTNLKYRNILITKCILMFLIIMHDKNLKKIMVKINKIKKNQLFQKIRYKKMKTKIQLEKHMQKHPDFKNQGIHLFLKAR